MFAAKNALHGSYAPPIGLDAVSHVTPGALTSPSWAHIIGKSVVGYTLIVVAAATVSSNPSALKIGGVSVSEITGTYHAFSSGYLTVWSLLTKTLSGSQTIALTDTSSYTAAAAASYLNVGTVWATAGGSNLTGTSISGNLYGTGPIPAGALTVAAFASSTSGSFTQGSGFTSRYSAPFSSGVNYPFMLEDQLKASSLNATATSPGGNTAWCAAAYTPAA